MSRTADLELTPQRRESSPPIWDMDAVADVLQYPGEKLPVLCVVRESDGRHRVHAIYDPAVRLTAVDLRWIADRLDELDREEVA